MKSKFLVLNTIAIFSTLLPARADVGGEAGLARKYVGKLNQNASYTDQCALTIEIVPVLFEVNSFKDKYKVVRIRVENWMSQSITLSPEEDEVELELEGGAKVRGTFSLKRQDGPLWGELSDVLRKSLAYPLSIRGAKGDKTRSPEIIYVFVFFPADKVPNLPLLFRYAIKSVGKTVEIRVPPTPLS